MKLTVFNGSPRGKSGNTEIMLGRFLTGFESISGNSSEVFHLQRVEDHPAAAEAFGRAEAVLVGLPLYLDAMPGVVMAFFERLEQYRGRAANPGLGFLVQSGYFEAVHSRALERYLEHLAEHLACPYLGTMVRGGCEMLHRTPEKRNRRLFSRLEEIGRDFGRQSRLDPVLLAKLAGLERFSAVQAFFMKQLFRLGDFNGLWKPMFKAHGTYSKRHARPYQE
jgi:hypothetical protein